MTKKKRREAINAYIISMVGQSQKVQAQMVLGEVGTRMSRIERKIDAVMKHLGIEQTGFVLEDNRMGDDVEANIKSSADNWPNTKPDDCIIIDKPLSEEEAKEFTKQWEEKHKLQFGKRRKKK